MPLLTSYSFGEHTIPITNIEKDLGIKISSKLDWKDQTAVVCMKANRMLGLVKRTTLEISDESTRKILYLQLVRSHFSYASQVWCPQSVRLVMNVERVQRRATKYILGLSFDTGVPCLTRLRQLDLLPISYWHEYLDMILLYKTIRGHVQISEDTNSVYENIGKTRRSNRDPNVILLKIPFAKTVCFQSSFFIRASRIRNCLKTDLRSKFISLATFKRGLLKYYKNAMISVYDVDDPRTWKTVCMYQVPFCAGTSKWIKVSLLIPYFILVVIVIVFLSIICLFKGPP